MAECISLSYKLEGIDLGCSAGMGGVKTLYLINEADVTIDIDRKGTNNAGIPQVKSLALAGSNKFKEFKFRKGTASMTTTYNTDDTGSFSSFTTELALQFSQMESQKRMQIMAMCYNSLKGVVVDSNDRYWLLGADYPINASAATGVTGVGAQEFNGYTVTLKDEANELPFEINKEWVKQNFAALIDKPVTPAA